MTTDLLDIKRTPLSYESKLQRRDTAQLSTIVIHCTELESIDQAREFGERIQHQSSQTGNSGHFYIGKDGAVYEFVSPQYVAHHVVGQNEHSIGIELDNRGRYPNWFDSNTQTVIDEYPPMQIDSLISLLAFLTTTYQSLRLLSGHEELDDSWIPSENDPSVRIKRKIDPGPLFPWETVESKTSLNRLTALSKNY